MIEVQKLPEPERRVNLSEAQQSRMNEFVKEFNRLQRNPNLNKTEFYRDFNPSRIGVQNVTERGMHLDIPPKIRVINDGDYYMVTLPEGSSYHMVVPILDTIYSKRLHNEIAGGFFFDIVNRKDLIEKGLLIKTLSSGVLCDDLKEIYHQYTILEPALVEKKGTDEWKIVQTGKIYLGGKSGETDLSETHEPLQSVGELAQKAPEGSKSSPEKIKTPEEIFGDVIAAFRNKIEYTQHPKEKHTWSEKLHFHSPRPIGTANVIKRYKDLKMPLDLQEKIDGEWCVIPFSPGSSSYYLVPRANMTWLKYVHGPMGGAELFEIENEREVLEQIDKESIEKGYDRITILQPAQVIKRNGVFDVVCSGILRLGVDESNYTEEDRRRDDKALQTWEKLSQSQERVVPTPESMSVESEQPLILSEPGQDKTQLIKDVKDKQEESKIEEKNVQEVISIYNEAFFGAIKMAELAYSDGKVLQKFCAEKGEDILGVVKKTIRQNLGQHTSEWSEGEKKRLDYFLEAVEKFRSTLNTEIPMTSDDGVLDFSGIEHVVHLARNTLALGFANKLYSHEKIQLRQEDKHAILNAVANLFSAF